MTVHLWQDPPRYLIQQSTSPVTLDIAFVGAAVLIAGVGAYITRNQYRWSKQFE